MKQEVFMQCFVFLLCLLCISIILYFYHREQKLFRNLQKMLDNAIAGTFENKHLDESKLSIIESSMWHYLCKNELSYQKITEQKQQIQALISDISHQTVTPISNIILYSQLLEEWQMEITKQEIELPIEELRAIREQAKKLDFFIQSLVKLSRLETGIIAVNAKRQDIQIVLSSIKQQFMPKAEQKGIKLQIEDISEFAVFDQKWTIEAIGNIVDNAIKYTLSNGNISVHIEKYVIFLRIDIIDNGIGIQEAEQGKIFTRFYRSSEVSEKEGLGLGLYLAREIIKAQNGYIKVTSKPGQGSIFSVFLLRKEER